MRIINKILGIESPSKKYMKKMIEIYSCDTKKNIECKKTNCGKEFCNKTTQYRYSKRTLTNYIKKIINKIRGKYI